MTHPAQTRTCPFLGLPDDPQSHFSFPEPAHICRAWDKPARVDLAHQGGYCLGGNYPECPRYKRRTRPLPIAPSGISVTPVTAPDEFVESRRSRVMVSLLVTLLALAAMAVLVAFLAFALTPPGAAVATESPTAAAVVETPQITPEPTAAPTPAPPTPSPAPTPSPSPSPTPSPTPTPTPTATPEPEPTPIIHVVEKGETVRSIAYDYGVAWRAIVELNELENPNLIRVGEELLIPVAEPTS